MANAKTCDKCGKFYIPGFTGRRNYVNRETKPRYLVHELDYRGEMSNPPHDLCEDCQKELDEYLSEFFKSKLLVTNKKTTDGEGLVCNNYTESTVYKAVPFPEDAELKGIDEE